MTKPKRPRVRQPTSHLADYDQDAIAALKAKFDARVVTLRNGCILPDAHSGGTLRLPGGRTLSFAHFSFMLRTGSTPTNRLRSTCRTAGCCEASHLEDHAPKPLEVWRRPGENREPPLTDADRLDIIRMFHRDHIRLREIADQYQVSTQSIHRIIRRAP